MSISKPGPANLITDVPGLHIGCSQDETIMTGVTVILPEQAAVCSAVIAGGGPGTRETEALAPDRLVETVQAVVLSGGSVYGLAAADGVVASLGAAGEGFALMDLPGVPRSPVVPSAILYDLANGGDKNWGETPPYYSLGRQALEVAKSTSEGGFELGASGAGFGARAGAVRGGLGSASIQLQAGPTIGAVTAVNCFGSTYMPGTDVFWAWPFEIDQEFGGARPPSDFTMDATDWGAAKVNPSWQERQNTTIACVATDVALTPAQAHRVGQLAISGFSRSIRPVFTPFDGDVLFVLSTAKRELPEPHALNIAQLGELAASVLARSVARGVYTANLA